MSVFIQGQQRLDKPVPFLQAWTFCVWIRLATFTERGRSSGG
jgi:hypothetical protein